MNNQKGYIDIDFTGLFVLAGIGLLAVIIGVPAGLCWIWNHIEVIIK